MMAGIFSELFLGIFRGIPVGIYPSDAAPVTPTLPAGAIGVWYADQYQATPRKLLPNAVSSVPVSANLFTGSRRLFNSSVHWAKFGTVTITDATVVADDGSTDASTMDTTGNSGINYPLTTTTAGTFTIAVWVRSASGSDQDFRMGVDFGSTAVKTATTTWQRFTHTVTVTAAAHEFIPVWAAAGLAALDLEICDAELYAGASAGTQVSPDGHMYLGSSDFDTRATATAGELDLSASGYGTIQLAENTTFSAVTIMTVSSKVADGSDYNSMLSKIGAYTTFSALWDELDGPAYYHSGSNRSVQGAGLYDFKDLGYHFHCIRFSGTVLDFFVDDVLMYSRTVTVGSVSGRDFWCGIMNSATLVCGHKLNSLVLYPTALTNTQVVDEARLALVARAELSSLTVTPISRVIVGEGDSITANALSYVYKYGPNSTPQVVGMNNAVGGSTLATMSARASALDAMLPANIGSRKFILVVLIGANDLYSYGGGSAQYAIDLAAYLDARRALGWKVVTVSPLPRSDATLTAPEIATHNTRRIELATIQSTWVGVHCDGFVDFANDATMGEDADSDNVTYYSDKLHPTTTTGQAHLETLLRPVVDAL